MTKFFLPDGPQIDRLCMLESVEARSPFVDIGLVELALGQLDKSNTIRVGSKEYLRELIGNLLPKSMLVRGKRSFTPPIRHWYKAINA